MRLSPNDALRLLAIDVETLFTLDADGRIARENDPDHPAPPRLFLAGGSGGVIVRLRRDVSAGIARQVLDLADACRGWPESEEPPAFAAAFIACLGGDRPSEDAVIHVIHQIPPCVVRESSTRFIDSDTPAGDDMIARLTGEGMPAPLRQAGFLSPADFWPPWCVALDGEEVASIAFAARIGEHGAEIGVYTLPECRGRGLAAAVTARWSALPALELRALFYSARTTNRPSRRVIERLGLPRIGASLRIA